MQADENRVTFPRFIFAWNIRAWGSNLSWDGQDSKRADDTRWNRGLDQNESSCLSLTQNLLLIFDTWIQNSILGPCLKAERMAKTFQDRIHLSVLWREIKTRNMKSSKFGAIAGPRVSKSKRRYCPTDPLTTIFRKGSPACENFIHEISEKSRMPSEPEPQSLRFESAKENDRLRLLLDSGKRMSIELDSKEREIPPCTMDCSSCVWIFSVVISFMTWPSSRRHQMNDVKGCWNYEKPEWSQGSAWYQVINKSTPIMHHVIFLFL